MLGAAVGTRDFVGSIDGAMERLGCPDGGDVALGALEMVGTLVGFPDGEDEATLEGLVDG